MPGPSPAPCTFPDDFVQVALDTVRRRTVPVQAVQRFRLILLLHEQPDMKNDKAAKEVGLSAPTTCLPTCLRTSRESAQLSRQTAGPLEKANVHAAKV